MCVWNACHIQIIHIIHITHISECFSYLFFLLCLGHSYCHFVCHPFGCMQIRLKYMEMTFCDKDSPALPHTTISPIAKCGSPINFLYDYYGCARAWVNKSLRIVQFTKCIRFCTQFQYDAMRCDAIW